jgi:hypothetical protein
MRSKKELESEIQGMKEQIERINNATANSLNVEEILKEKSKSDEVGSNMLALFKYVMDENRKTNIILKEMYGKLERMESDLDADYYEQDDQAHLQENNRFAKVQPVSGLDAKIMQIIQISGMACADDIKLHKLGLLERYQLGHKVYYKYDAGKTTNTLIVSPPQ